MLKTIIGLFVPARIPGASLLATRLLPNRRRHQTKLRGVNGYTGKGGVTIAVSKNGKREMGVALRGIAGQTAEIYANGALTGTIELHNGRADQIFNTKRGEAVPEVIAETQIDIRQNGQIILEGDFTQV